MTAPTPRGLAVARFLARAALLLEIVWPAIWPAAGVAVAFLCAALLNLLSFLPGWLHAAVLAAVAAGIGFLLFRGLRHIRPPDERDADRRLESKSALTHRPLAVLIDQPTRTDPAGQALWQAHVDRAVARIGQLRVGLPQIGMGHRDPRAFRNLALVSLLACLVVANIDTPARLRAAFSPSLPTGTAGPATEVQAWITPPAYTRVAPIFLKSDGDSISVPAGSRLSVSVSGERGMPTLSVGGIDQKAFTALDQSSFQAEYDLNTGETVVVNRGGTTLARWNLTVVADQPPTVAWGDDPGRASYSQQTRLPWEVTDDYGVTGLQAEIRLKDRPDAAPLVVNIPLPGGASKSAKGVSQPDLTAHPWAGLPVTAQLVARDQPGQAAKSAEAAFTLPERQFHNPIARALIAARKTLSVHPDDRGDALAILDGLMQQGPLFGADASAFVTLSAIYYELVREHAEKAIPEAQQMLWQLALHMEEGQAEESARQLERARQAVRDALDRARQQPSDEARRDLEKKLEELRQAIERHMQALLQQAMRNNAVMPFDPKAMRLSDRDMQQMARDAEQAVREGRMQDAEQQMAELERMLDRLRNAQVQRGDRQANSRRQRGKRQQSVVQDLIGREGGLMDHSQQRGGTQPGAPDPGSQRDADARVQQALRRALGELMQQFTDLTGQASQGLGEADQAMRDAGTALGQGDDRGAGQLQQQAIEDLQKGNREMAQAMAKMGQGQPNGGEEGDDEDDGSMGMMMPDGQQGNGQNAGPIPGNPGRADSGNRDPLGRYNQGTSADTDDSQVPEERERQRTHAIQEELRRRDANQERPRQELDYIDRLLKQF